ncbi:MAG: DUF2141 domain-containing protein [Candidatus Delongbacteria bacterium]|nr:DUF2141 domain-containing protein [Candidatus Delongbacteria bacterium]
MKKVIFLLITFFTFMIFAQEVKDSLKVTVSIEGFNNNKGFCRLLVFDNDEGFPEEPDFAISVYSKKIKENKCNFDINLTSGIYAITILHDENSNEELDKTWYGKPTEGFGISNNVKTRFGPPSYEESTVRIIKDPTELKIKMKYI